MTSTERNPEATLYVGDLASQVDEAIIWELFLQAAPVVNVYIPRDKVTGEHQTYGFVELASELDRIKLIEPDEVLNLAKRVETACARPCVPFFAYGLVFCVG